MDAKELVTLAGKVQQALLKRRRTRYLAYSQQLSEFTYQLRDLTQESKKLGFSLSREWFAACQHCCEAISRRLDGIVFFGAQLRVALDRRPKEVPTVSAVFAELRAIESEFGSVEFDSEENALCVTTEPIILDGIYLGPFQISLVLERLGDPCRSPAYFVLAQEPHPAANDEAVTHPHISNDVVCEGDGAAAIHAALEAGRLGDFFTMVRCILETYNPDSPYVALSDWDGIPCYDCGYVMDSENSCYCSCCDRAICDECSTVCLCCSDVVCSDCASKCEVCENPLCARCSRTKCISCQSVCCESCLNEGLCPDCLKERNQEDENETTPESTSDTAAAEAPCSAPAGAGLARTGHDAQAAVLAVQPHGLGQAPLSA